MSKAVYSIQKIKDINKCKKLGSKQTREVNSSATLNLKLALEGLFKTKFPAKEQKKTVEKIKE